jgi:Uma2 family endonuclease
MAVAAWLQYLALPERGSQRNRGESYGGDGMGVSTVETLEQVIVTELPRWIAEHPTLRTRLQAALAPAALLPPRRMTYPEFLAWADEDTLAEWVALPDTDEGEVLEMSPASARHQLLGDFLLMLMRTYVEVHDLGVVLSAPFQMKMEHGREPDLLFVAQAQRRRLRETYLDGPADLVVEIISSESAERDRGKKFYEYEGGGVPAYWLLDPLREWAEFYLLEAGRYRLAYSGAEGIYRSQMIPGFWLEVAWLWQDPLPQTLNVLRELGLI